MKYAIQPVPPKQSNELAVYVISRKADDSFVGDYYDDSTNTVVVSLSILDKTKIIHLYRSSEEKIGIFELTSANGVFKQDVQ